MVSHQILALKIEVRALAGKHFFKRKSADAFWHAQALCDVLTSYVNLSRSPHRLFAVMPVFEA